MEQILEDVFLPIAICVILPIAVVAIICYTSIYRDKKRSEILLEAIKANKELDTEQLTKALSKPRKNALEILRTRLLRGCIFSLVGINMLLAYAVSYFTDGPFREAMSIVKIGLLCIAIGFSYLIVYFVSRKEVKQQREE